mmetsp:Transcript_12767/g.21666  ORF Transcript_12767/g.21666 Transcript_12767/m.21666 type:complete len:269 (+) Transcript_12767:122-928(+)|eukprot:CAMPEP_0198216790 /NCGR_PEP_ID=MMETSP1445-20131203/59710_1 /TAXON_ID=36898 /ORGANISM="Pyramimonas sp., Strain CCMP2087" /LENGTH=268 /DNA_ID=CAMNT_0043893197 /DNA_START=115 /DNA_END=921 /DNA_ORIENTATION=+
MSATADAATFRGSDSQGNIYDSVNEMWSKELLEKESASDKPKWYQQGIDYWDKIPPTVDGVLGGFGFVTSADVLDSDKFLNRVFKEQLLESKETLRKLVALDCGAGVGRITDQFLLRRFYEVDLVEPLKHFLDEAEKQLTFDPSKPKPGHVGRAVNYFCEPLETFVPAPGRYDVIWIQWVIGHLTDDDFVLFFDRCKRSLTPDGLILMKENNCGDGFLVDKEDSSLTRSDKYFHSLFDKCGLKCVDSEVQTGFPKELFVVRMYALRPQ